MENELRRERGVREVKGLWVGGAREKGCMEVKDGMKGNEGGEKCGGWVRERGDGGR